MRTEHEEFASEDDLVARHAAIAAARLAVMPAAATLPMVATLATLFADHADRSRLVIWVVVAAVASAAALLAVAWAREMHQIDRPERGIPALVVSAGLMGMAWGTPTFLIDFDTMGLSSLFLVFTLGASMLSVIVFAPVTRLFVAFQSALGLTASAGLMTEFREETIAVTGAGVAWFSASIVLFRLVHEDNDQAIRLRLRTDDLVASLSDEQARLAELNDLLQHQATHDPLTELANRRGSLQALEYELAQRGPDELVALVYLDLDHFKQVNDSHGHDAGDALLQATAERIRRVAPAGATAGRIGGDELVVILPRLKSAAEAIEISGRTAYAIGQPIHLHGREFVTSTSVGIAIAPHHATEPDALLRDANAALHRAKANGRGRVEVFDAGLQRQIDSRRTGEGELRRALDHGEIVPFLQPEVDAATGRVVGAEILARWLRRDGTILNAMAFIPTARELGLLERLQRSVIAQANPVIRRLHTLGLPEGFRFRINLTTAMPDQLWAGEVLDQLLRTLPPALITVDITERLVGDHVASAAGTLASIREMGMRVGLDDFGRGGSSIMLMRRLPLDEVRIDQSVLEGIGNHVADRAVVRAIVTLVHDLELSITADGVETPVQSDALLAFGCRRQQGLLFAPALPPAAFEQFLVDRELAATNASGQRWSTEELA